MKRPSNTVRIMIVALMVGFAFWIVDGVLNYYFFHYLLRFMIFEEPKTLLDAIALNISPYTFFVRISFLVACIIAGALTVRFVTKQEKAEEAMRESENKYRTLTENINVGIYRNTPGSKGKFIEMNPALIKMFGYEDKDEIFAMTVADLYLNPEDRKKFNERMLRDGFVRNEELRLKKKDGTPFWASITAVAVPDEKGEIKYYDGTIEDITERKRAEETLRKAHDELEVKVKERTKELSQANIRLKELDSLKSMFIASMSHELRTPLNSIIGFTGIMLQGIAGKITEEQRKQLTMVKNSANHLLELINDVIDVSKIETGQVELAIEEFDLPDIIQEVKDSFRVAVDEKGLKLSLEMPERLMIKSDQRRVKQIIMNLVSNAVKFTDKGKIEIEAAKKDRKVEVSVKDTGVGIRKEDMKMLFKQFSRIHIKDRSIVKGTGLGLYISEQIVDLLGGQIKAESVFGKGSKFTLSLPLKYKKVKT